MLTLGQKVYLSRESIIKEHLRLYPEANMSDVASALKEFCDIVLGNAEYFIIQNLNNTTAELQVVWKKEEKFCSHHPWADNIYVYTGSILLEKPISSSNFINFHYYV